MIKTKKVRADQLKPGDVLVDATTVKWVGASARAIRGTAPGEIEWEGVRGSRGWRKPDEMLEILDMAPTIDVLLRLRNNFRERIVALKENTKGYCNGDDSAIYDNGRESAYEGAIEFVNAELQALGYQETDTH